MPGLCSDSADGGLMMALSGSPDGVLVFAIVVELPQHVRGGSDLQNNHIGAAGNRFRDVSEIDQIGGTGALRAVAFGDAFGGPDAREACYGLVARDAIDPGVL
jgi:hypothetical protein